MASRCVVRNIYNTSVWRTARRQTLERDDYRCQIRGRRCKGTATEADHIVPVADGGAPYDLSNLRAACKSCNVARANSQKHRDGWRRARAHIVLVVGPPCSGKTTWVNDRADSLDVVVDYDAIARSLGPQDSYATSEVRHAAVMEARNAILRQIRRGELDARRIYIVSANPRAETIFPYHDVVIVDPGPDEVMRRCHEERPPSFLCLVEDWYAQRNGQATREW